MLTGLPLLDDVEPMERFIVSLLLGSGGKWKSASEYLTGWVDADD